MNVTLKRTLAAVLTLCMLLAVLPTMVFAADEPGAGEQQEGLVLNKTAQLEDDGTYTIKLEAYATGVVTSTTTITTEKTVKPVDVILVLDQSGSMVQSNVEGIPTGYYNGASSQNSFVNSRDFYYQAQDGNYYKLIARKTLVSSESYYLGKNGVRYTQDEIANTWRDYNGTNRTASNNSYFALPTLKTFHYYRPTGSYQYINDDGSGEIYSSTSSRNAALTALQNAYPTSNGYTVQTVGNGDNRCAAVYVTVSYVVSETYRYDYYYENDEGEEILIRSGNPGLSSEVDSQYVPFQIYERGTQTGTRLAALQYAAKLFVDNIQANAEANGVDHRVAVVGYASNDCSGHSGTSSAYYYSNTELFIGANQYNYAVNGKDSTYNSSGNLASNHYGEAFQSVNTTAGYNNLTASINALAGNGATYPNLGFEMANGIFANNQTKKEDPTKEDRDRIVIFFTDGAPGWSGYESGVATSTNTQATISKDTYGATVYTVALLSTAPTAGGDVDKFLRDTSSNNKYTLAIQADKLTGFFQEITNEIENTEYETEASVTLTEKAYMLDELSEFFVLPEGYNTSAISVQTAAYEGNGQFSSELSFYDSAKVELTDDGNGITVSGFNYISDENMVVTDQSGVHHGNKLIVTIPGVLAKDEAAQNKNINTNSTDSGIWDTATNGVDAMIKAFPMPQTRLDKKFFVLDYAKKTELKIDNLLGIDEAEDEIFSELSGITAIAGDWGNTLLSGGKLTYTPTTMLWDGWDYFYALNKDNTIGDKVTHNIWNKVSVVPANNVYFEDTFITNDETGVVGIEFGDGWDTMEPGTNQGNADDGNQGWITDFEGETGDSDGTVASTNKKGATATFTFMGTGVDIYTRTNDNTGSIAVFLYEIDEDQPIMKKLMLIDNLSQNGEYYQIPSATFCDLPHGEYKVEIIVNSAKNPDGTPRSMYYLDGIRVYNPLGTDKDVMEEVKEGYGDEIGATFTSIREILLKNETLNENDGSANGVVYIDYNTETDTEGDNTSLLGTYKDLGPKNEVYLATGNAIAFRVPAGLKIQVGMKGPQGVTAATVSNGNDVTMIPVNGAGDQFYSITPKTVGEDALVVIKNSGANLLSITKLKVSGDPETTTDTEGFFEVDMMELMDYVRSFNTLREVFHQENLETEIPTIGEIGIEKPIKNPGNPGKPVKPIMPPIGKHVQSSELEEQLFSGVRKLLAR